MTDITELAQSLKAAAEKATPGRWEYYPGNTSIEYNVDSMDEDQGSIVYVDSGDFTQAQTERNGEFIALANPASILALVEALEKAQETIAFQQGEIKALLSSLESRTVTVKLPKKNIGWDRDEDDCWNNAIDACAEALTEQGINVEAE
ncbi:ead/Ea22-like family protein [Klebsiella pneumoniae]|uniref:ead/Ea22-like family protein n=1 Tax=Klebsiella pneumoniae TaxID=573 RepID=UPI00201496D0|nr:ead/Ea22-like family protein [Klebsiella pneumoniae]MCL3619130.1 ead/Ea22-like family protein [Klebsiella pneumoniae]MEB6136171.1 ead/Ea22-like family protein [Klebsiella pneumoniae]